MSSLSRGVETFRCVAATSIVKYFLITLSIIDRPTKRFLGFFVANRIVLDVGGFSKMKLLSKLTMLAALIFLLSPQAVSAKALLVAKIDISSQTMTVSRNGAVVNRWKVSTAGAGYRTPTGQYRPTRMHRMWYSRKYHNSPMPHSIFFRGGYAIHGTGSISRLGRPASHGCVRLHPANAAKLFSMVKNAGPGNTSIVITR